MTPFALSGLLIVVTAVPLGLLVFARKSGDRVAKAFMRFDSLAIGVWGLGSLVIGVTQDPTLALRAWRLSHVGVIFIAVFWWDFVYQLCNVSRSSARRIVYTFGIAASVLSIFSPLISDVWYAFDSFYYVKQTLGYLVLFILWTVIVVSGHQMLWKRFQAVNDSDERKRLIILFTGVALGFAGGMMNFLPMWGLEIYPIGNFAIPVAVLIQAYAIFAYKLMDVEIVITKTGLLLGTYVVVLGIPFMVGWKGREWLEAELGNNWWLVPLSLGTILATIGPFGYASLRRKAERHFLKEQEAYQRGLQHAAQGMTRVRSVAKLSRLVVRVVSRAVRVTHASLFLWDKEAEHYVLRASEGPARLSTYSRYALEDRHPFVEWLRRNRRVLRFEATNTCHESAAVAKELTNLAGTLVIPGFIEERLVGFLVLGRKLSGLGYSQDDLHAFATLANEAAMAIENAQSYEELQRVNEQLEMASERLLVQERLAAAGELAAGLAHEIRNPLASIKTFAEYLPTKYKDASFRERFFRIVQTEIERIDGIVKDLLNFAKPAPLQLQPVNISRLAQDTLTLLSDRCLKQGVHLATSFKENGHTIEGDPQQLKQVILNLLLNSLDAMPQGGELSVQTKVTNGILTLRVTDTGEGVPHDRIHQIWDPFFTTKERGMGLGLAIVKGIVERHGGRISFSSRPGHGTVVEIELPAGAGTQEVSRG